MGVLRRLLAGLLLVSFGAALGLGALEAGVRVLHLVPSRFWQPHPLLGTWHVAGKTGWWTQEEHEFTVPVTISSAGLRDVEHEVAKPPGVRRVLLLGDSYIEALQVPLEQMIGRQLEQRLSEAGGRRWEVISVGVSGYGTASELLYYREMGRRWSPDVVVLAFYPGNDVRNNSPSLEPVLPPLYDEDGRLLRIVGKQGGGERRRGVLGSLQAYEYVRKQILTRNPAVARLLAGAGLMKESALRPIPMVDGVPVDYWVYAQTPSAEWERAWAYSEGLITELAAAAREDGAEFALAIVTARDHLYPDSWRQVLATYPGMSGKRWDLEGPERRILDFCRREKIACLHLSPIFAAHLDDGERLHFVHDGHWTAAGHALAARSLAAFLMDNDSIHSHETEVR
jgi:hypothetical protein